MGIPDFQTKPLTKTSGTAPWQVETESGAETREVKRRRLVRSRVR